jgi:CHAD domain-containing protein
MKKKQEKEYFNAEWKEMKAFLKAYLETGRPDDLHKFRVQVKKLRSMLILLDSASGKKLLQKDFKPVRRVFKEAGDIRNVQVNLKLAREYKVTDEDFIHDQVKWVEVVARDFKANGEKYTEKLKIAYKNIEAQIRPVDDIHINQFYSGQLHHISDSLDNLRFDESLHECRKWIKVLIYNYQFTAPVLQVKLNIDYLQDVQKAIGDWHDNMLAKELFAELEKKDKALAARINRKHTKLENNIKTLVADFYTLATTTVELLVEQLS